MAIFTKDEGDMDTANTSGTDLVARHLRIHSDQRDMKRMEMRQELNVSMSTAIFEMPE